MQYTRTCLRLVQIGMKSVRPCPLSYVAHADQVAGQMVNLPTVVKSTETLNLKLISVTSTPTEDGRGKKMQADEIKAEFKHRFEFRLPLPKGAREVTMNTTLFVYSTGEGIVRLADRPQDQIPDNSLLSVSSVCSGKGARVVRV